MKIIAIIFLALLGLSEDVPRSWEKACAKELKNTFEAENIRLIRQSQDVNDHDRPSPGIVLYNIMDSDDLIGYAVLTTAQGRYDYFDYMVIYNKDLTIVKVRVFEYRSDHGYEICNKKWLSQFEGRKGCKLEYDVDIDAISGATYSATSITEDISFLCRFLEEHIQ